MKNIPLARPYVPAAALEGVAQVLASGHLTEGPVTRRFEEAFAAFVGVDHAIAVTSCTTGLELVLRALGIGAGDEVIVPDYTYPATAQAVMLTGATAVIVDVDAYTLNIAYDALAAAITPRTKALMPVSLFGNPLDWSMLGTLAAKHGLPIVEDAACGLGSSYGSKRTGGFGTAAVFSLHPRKSITTGEGGMITTNDAELAATLRSVKRFGLDKLDAEREDMHFVRLGGNAKMSDILAAVGLAQMHEAEALFAQRVCMAEHYTELLGEAARRGLVRFVQTTPMGTHAWQSYCIFAEKRDRLLTVLRAQGIEVQVGTYALHQEPLFNVHPLCRLVGSMQGSANAHAHTLALPFFFGMTPEEQRRVVCCLLQELTCA